MSWLSGWNYRKSHEIVGSTAGAQTDYQIRIKVHYGSGTDSGEDVYLNEHCRTDFGDVRFTSNDGVTELSYWIEEKVDGDYAIFWVKVPSIPVSPNTATIYIYYGNPSAESISNGEATFILFDHFSGSVLDTEKWTPRTEPNALASEITVHDSLLDIYHYHNAFQYGNTYVESVSSWTDANHAIEAKVKVEVTTWGDGSVLSQFVSNSYGTIMNIRTFSKKWQCRIISGVGDSGYVDIGVSVASGVFYRISLRRKSATKTQFVVDTTSKTDTTYPQSIPDSHIQFSLGRKLNIHFLIDWVALRKIVDPEPSHGLWGSEETPGVAHEVTVAEKLGLVDGVARRVDYGTLVSGAEKLGLIDSITPKWSAHVTVAEKLGFIDAVAKVKTAHVAVAEKLGLVDGALKKTAYRVAAAEKLGLLDAVRRVRCACVTVAEKLGFIDREKERKIRIEDLPDHTRRGGAQTP